jgi:8-oxo-dGTP diphosphatase
MYALPGGFVEQDETPETCAVRELKEEAGVSGNAAGLINFYDAVDRDVHRHTIGFAYVVDVPSSAEAIAGDDAAGVEWWPLAGLPPMAFDHLHILNDYKSGKRIQ